MIHRKAVVVLGSDDDVFHPSVFSKRHDFFGVEVDRVERAGKLLVLRNRDAGHPFVHDPFADAVVGLSIDFIAKLRVQAPVNEHGIIAFVKQLAAFGVLGPQLDHGFAPHFVHPGFRFCVTGFGVFSFVGLHHFRFGWCGWDLAVKLTKHWQEAGD